MANSFVNLHVERRRSVFIFAACALLLFLLFNGFALATSENISELSSLLRSDYKYSAVISQGVELDDYYRFSAGIGFSLSDKADIGLNADVLMQPHKVEYTDAVCWNANILDSHEVAISKNLAEHNNLHVGDKLYSEHIVTGTISEYTIAQIVPAVKTSRISRRDNFSNGIIIMGYDSLYEENISHSILFFTQESVESVAAAGYVPEDIIYRDDEIFSTIKDVFPYFAVLIALTISIMCYEAIRLTSDISANFKRMASLGYGKKKLDRSFIRYIYGVSGLTIVFSSMVSVVVSFLLRRSFIDGLALIVMIIIESVTVMIISSVQRRRLWRK